MKLNSIPAALILLFLGLALPAAGENLLAAEGAAKPLEWTGKNGVTIRGSFIRLSGDAVLIDRDGQELTLSMSLMDDDSARQARKLAGIEEPPPAVPPPKPIRIQMQQISASRLQTDAKSGRESRFGPSQKKYNSARFQMGSPADEPGREEIEPEHTVWLKKDFLLKTTEVTWEEWSAARDRAANYGYTDLSPGTNGRGGDPSGRHPVLGITWWDAVKWCNLMSQIENRTPVYYTHPSFKPEFILKTGSTLPHANWEANGYRLPTEAEWEFACRPGSSSRAFHTGPIHRSLDAKDDNLDKAGWYTTNSKGGTQPVGGKEANRFGLFDMHGNAAEWCWDFAAPLAASEAFDPRGPENGVNRIIRGGSWSDPPRYCRAAYRGSRHPSAMPNAFVGFRPAMNLPPIDKR